MCNIFVHFLVAQNRVLFSLYTSQKNTLPIENFKRLLYNIYMKRTIFFIFGVSVIVLLGAKAHAENRYYPYICAREVPTFTEPQYEIPCNEQSQTAKNHAGKALQKEITDFQEEDLSEILKDNGSNGQFIAEEGIRRLRRHEACLEAICDNWLENCASPNYGMHTSSEKKWCDERVLQLRAISRKQTFTVTTQNQARKNRSLLMEKFGQISTRNRYYLHYWMTQTIKDFNFFKGKVDGMIKSPNY